VAAVLLIEDETPIVRLMAWYLIDAGFEVSKVARPDDAGRHLRSHAAVIVFNTGMPVAERRHWIQAWHQQSPDSRVLDVSETDAMHRLPDIGADGSLRLPFLAETFVDMVSELMPT